MITDETMRSELCRIVSDGDDHRRMAAWTLLLPEAAYNVPSAMPDPTPERLLTILEAIPHVPNAAPNMALSQVVPEGDVGRAVLFLSLHGRGFAVLRYHGNGWRTPYRSAKKVLELRKRRPLLTVADALELAHVCNTVSKLEHRPFTDSSAELVAVGISPLRQAIKATERTDGWEFVAYTAALNATISVGGCQSYLANRQRVLDRVRMLPRRELLLRALAEVLPNERPDVLRKVAELAARDRRMTAEELVTEARSLMEWLPEVTFAGMQFAEILAQAVPWYLTPILESSETSEVTP